MEKGELFQEARNRVKNYEKERYTQLSKDAEALILSESKKRENICSSFHSKIFF